MLGPFATAGRRTPPVLHCHSPGVATVARRHCRTPPVHRCPQQHRQQRQRVTEGTAVAPWNGPNNNNISHQYRFPVKICINHCGRFLPDPEGLTLQHIHDRSYRSHRQRTAQYSTVQYVHNSWPLSHQCRAVPDTV